MVRGYLSGGLALLSLAAVSGCWFNEAETPERCIERFEALLAEGPDLGDGRFQPIFTYDISDTADVLETLYGDAEGAKGGRVTVVHGPTEPALDKFYQAEVTAKGAIFAADDFTLYRIAGAPGSRGEAVAAGCRGALPNATLVRIQWIPLPAGPGDRT